MCSSSSAIISFALIPLPLTSRTDTPGPRAPAACAPGSCGSAPARTTFGGLMPLGSKLSRKLAGRVDRDRLRDPTSPLWAACPAFPAACDRAPSEPRPSRSIFILRSPVVSTSTVSRFNSVPTSFPIFASGPIELIMAGPLLGALVVPFPNLGCGLDAARGNDIAAISLKSPDDAATPILARFGDKASGEVKSDPANIPSSIPSISIPKFKLPMSKPEGPPSGFIISRSSPILRRLGE
mmetsp:Transcript_47678/g.97432  ORF Transcript_47678/g.97432 Transcript_47678/m.97432 type:complete len:238 (-) Transcript_47678:108-821(-)